MKLSNRTSDHHYHETIFLAMFWRKLNSYVKFPCGFSSVTIKSYL